MNELLLASQPPSVEFPANSQRHLGFVSWGILGERLRLPHIQREVNQEWVEELERGVLEKYERTGFYHLGRLHLCSCGGELYLLDGQHRYYVLSRMGKRDIVVEFVIEEVDNEKAMNELFMEINRSRPAVICRNTGHQLILNGFRKHMTHRYGGYLSKSVAPYRPHIHLDSLIRKIEERGMIDKLGVVSLEDWIGKVEELNRYYRGVKHEMERWRGWGMDGVEKWLEKVHSKSAVSPLYLGLYVHFEWLDRLERRWLEGIGYGEMVHYPLNRKRQKISKRLRCQVWRKTNSGMDGSCYVCGGGIRLESFECGHKCAVFWGGRNTLDNLLAICRECNGAMGTCDLEVYRQKWISQGVNQDKI